MAQVGFCLGLSITKDFYMPSPKLAEPVILDAIASPDVLIYYNPKIRELGVFTESRFMAVIMSAEGDRVALSIRPGVWRKPRTEWLLWANSEASEVKHAIACGALSLASEETDIKKIEAFKAQELIRNSADVELLKEWSKDYAVLPAMVQEALEHKQSSMTEDVRSSSKFVFGNQVA